MEADESAFPTSGGTYGQFGMTKRELFAVMAMQGQLAAAAPDMGCYNATYVQEDGFETWRSKSHGKTTSDPLVENKLIRTANQNLAREAVAYADALIEALNHVAKSAEMEAQ